MQVRSRIRSAALAATALMLVASCTAVGAPFQSSADTPTVTPATGGGGVPVLAGFTAFDLAEVGYEQSEVFIEGTASAYEAAEPFGDDGKFDVAEASTAAYTTRAVVAKPSDPARFNGTVVVEWFNVSGGTDAGPDWMLAHNQLIREGFAWVGVSAQKTGVDTVKTDGETSGYQTGDSVRYADLEHPGDSYSYDIFSQAGQAILAEADTVLGGLEPENLIAVGESQSAGRMVTYIDAVHPVDEVYDGFLVHSRFGAGAPLSQWPQATVNVPSPTFIRDDLDVPVLVFQAEGDVPNSLNARQDDTDMFRLWEVAGTAHFDLYGLSIGMTDAADYQGAAMILESMRNPTNEPSANFTCSEPINTGPAHFVLDAAFHQLNQWVTEGVAPPTAPRLEVTSESPVTFATDEHGNVLGGIRTPAVDVPVAKLSGQSGGGLDFCFLFGTTEPFTQEKMDQLYPTHDDFVTAWIDATVSAYEAGFLTGQDAWEHYYAALVSDIGQ